MYFWSFDNLIRPKQVLNVARSIPLRVVDRGQDDVDRDRVRTLGAVSI